MKMSRILAAALVGAMSYGGKVPFGRAPVGGVLPLPVPKKPKDPYYGIKSKGRTGAAGRAGRMADAHRGTYIGQRTARGRDISRTASK